MENTDYALDSSGNYTIYTGAGLAHLANVVNGGDSLEGKTVTLADDIEVEDDASSQNTWTPVGNNDNPFSGVFNGNNHTISAYLQAENRDMGIFGTNAGSIENLTLDGSIMLYIDKYNEDYGYDEYSLGLIAVNKGTISSCVNNSDISSYIKEIETSTENGFNMNVGGIAGEVYAVESSAANITECINNGYITCSNNDSNYSCNIGGICGSALVYGDNLEISSCVNTCNVVGKSNTSYTDEESNDFVAAGGIAGAIARYGDEQLKAVIKNCANISSSAAVNIEKCSWGGGGGIAGWVYSSQVINCYNTQNVSVYPDADEAFAGGIAGQVKINSVIENCVNTGKNITGKSTNSIVPELSSGTVNLCYASNNSGADISGILNSSLFDKSSGRLETPVTVNGSEISNVAEALNAYVAAHPDEGYKTWSSYDSFGKAEPLISSIVLRQIKPAEENGNTSATAVVTNVSCSGLTVNKLTWEYNGLSAVYNDTALSGDTVFSFGIIIPEFVEADSNSSPVGLNVTAE